MQKPDYKVPSMAEINALKWNGFNAVSTFSGCGGSSLGYKMAGFKVLWASEFIPAAQETYRANHPTTILDTRDIRQVQAQEILDAIKMQRGELDLMDGSPPCASFSTVGKREAGWGKVKKYSDTTQRTDDLFFEFARLVEGVQPKVFVAENVSGLVKGTAKGYFLEIFARLKDCGYNVKCKVLDAQWLGVPQMRQRTIFVGVRNDLGIEPAHPKPLPYRYTVREALPWILAIEGANGYNGHAFGKSDVPAATAAQSRPLKVKATRDNRGAFGNGGDIVGTHWIEVEPESSIEGYAIGRERDTLAPGEKSEKYQNLVKPHLDRPSPCVTQTGANRSAASVTHPTEKRKFSIAELKRICAFPDDFQLTGTYAQQWERLGRAVPPVMMSHIAAVIRDDILANT